MVEPEPIGLAVIGVSGIARNCLAAARAAGSGLALRAVCATDGEPLARAAGEFEVPFATGEFREVLDRPDVDAVAIYTPDPLHFPMIRDALLAGKDVVVTKPMVVSSEESAQVLALLRQTGRTLLVGETSRFDRRTLAARRLLEDGDLGRLTFGETHYVHDMRPVFDRTPWRYQEPHPKDFPIGSMCHPISLITSFFGDVEESARLRHPQRGRSALPGAPPGHLHRRAEVQGGRDRPRAGGLRDRRAPPAHGVAQPLRHQRVPGQ